MIDTVQDDRPCELAMMAGLDGSGRARVEIRVS
jgi:hypothetical protein